MVLARGRALMVAAPPSPLLTGMVVLALDMEFLRTLPVVVVVTELVLSLREPALGRLLGVAVIWSFCWWRRRRSRLAKQRVHSGHSKGFSLVWDLS